MVARNRITELLILLAFGACVGYVIDKIERPDETPANRFSGPEPVLQSPEPDHRNLYLRHTLHLPAEPDSAWIRLVARDIVELYANGRLVEFNKEETVATVIVADLKPFLNEGANVIAIACRQNMLPNTPAASVTGQCVVGGHVLDFDVDSNWKCHNRIDRLGDYWTSVDYDDRNWASAERGQKHFTGQLKMPLSVATSPPQGSWIGAKKLNEHALVVEHSCTTPEPVVQGWLRVESNAALRFAINDKVVASEENTLGTNLPAPRNIMRIYDLAPWLSDSEHRVTFLLRAKQEQPQLRADLELIGRSGQTYSFQSDETWKWCQPTGNNWLDVGENAPDWQACDLVALDDKNLSAKQLRTVVPLDVPSEMKWHAIGMRLAMMLGAALAMGALIGLLGLLFGGLWQREGSRSVRPAILALVLPTTLLGLALVLVHDKRIADYWLYRVDTILVVLALVVLQWFALLWLRYPLGSLFGNRALASARLWDTRFFIPLAMTLIVASGAYLRTEQIATRPLSPDEVTMYRVSMSIWEYGYPTLEIHEDLPPVEASTSEIVPYGHWLVSMFVDSDRLIVRTMPTIWGIATILLLFRVGQVMFNPWVGVLAAGLYALSPYCVSMANSARYYSQLQFFALLVVYFFYRALRPDGPISVKYFWATIISFCLMFLSWEGSAIVGLGLAVAGLVYRRDRIRTLIFQPHVWAGAIVLLSLVLVQSSHRTMVQTARPLYGSGASDVSATPMWQYPGFQPWFYIWFSSWNNDTLLPAISLLLAFWLAIRHPFRHQTRYLLLIFLTICLVQALILPVTASRYGYHLTTLWLLFGSAGIWACWREISQWRPEGLRGLSIGYRRAIAAGILLPLVILSSGLGSDLSELTRWRMGSKSRNALKFPGQHRSTQYVLEHGKPDDIVIVNAPHVIDHYLKRPSDYWLQSQLHLQCLITDADSVPRHRYKGTPMLTDVEHLRDVFSRNHRIWFITEPVFNNRTNEDDAVKFIRDNMDVVFEDYASLVMFRDDHRPADLQQKNEKTLSKGVKFLP